MCPAACAPAGASPEEQTPGAHVALRRRRRSLRLRQGSAVRSGDPTWGNLWRSFPEDLVEMVFARLPVGRIVELMRDSHAWSTMSKSSHFRRACAERHPCSFLGLVRWVTAWGGGGSVRATVYDHESNEWAGFDLAGFPPGVRGDSVRRSYRDSMYAFDAGLVCFVPHGDLSVCPVVVCNPLTGDRRSLPPIRHEHRPAVMVELRVDDDTKAYEVTVVVGAHRVKRSSAISGHVPEMRALSYSSATGAWSATDAGWIHGSSWSLQRCRQTSPPRAFNCGMGIMHMGEYDGTWTHPHGWSVARGCMVVIFCNYTGIWEYAWRGSAYRIKGSLPMCPISALMDPPRHVHMFGSTQFLAVISNVHGPLGGPIIQVCDRTTGQWVETPPMPASERLGPGFGLDRTFCCDLRWDAIP
ncbi:hypothetical protein M758_12G000100 [Ceratodon purpureus]|nr:hypothetical protein M758_12G000100 [Ceratodon purpureus]